jgi:hypothetical protein
MRHGEWAEGLALAKGIEPLISKPLECNSKNDESDVTVNGSRARVGRELSGKR